MQDPAYSSPQNIFANGSIIISGSSLWSSTDTLTITYDGTRITMYINGVSTYTTAVASSVPMYFNSILPGNTTGFTVLSYGFETLAPTGPTGPSSVSSVSTASTGPMLLVNPTGSSHIYYSNMVRTDNTEVLVVGTTNTITSASQYSSILGGYNNTVSNTYASIAGGQNNVASGACSATLGGLGLVASATGGVAFGQYNAYGPNAGSDRVFAVGYGTSSAARLNLFSVTANGNAYVKGTLAAPATADYAEWFETSMVEDLVPGVAVVLDSTSGLLRRAVAGEVPMGVVRAPSGNIAILANAAEGHWHAKYQYLPDGTSVLDASGFQVVNPEYDPERTYVPRSQRPEWKVVALLGQVPLRDGEVVAPAWRRVRPCGVGYALWFIK